MSNGNEMSSYNAGYGITTKGIRDMGTQITILKNGAPLIKHICIGFDEAMRQHSVPLSWRRHSLR